MDATLFLIALAAVAAVAAVVVAMVLARRQGSEAATRLAALEGRLQQLGENHANNYRRWHADRPSYKDAQYQFQYIQGNAPSVVEIVGLGIPV